MAGNEIKDGDAHTRLTTTAGIALEVEELTKRFGGVVAVDGVTLSARIGEVTAIMGDNGAGKSTLLKCIVGLHRRDSGVVRLFGSEVAFTTPQEARKSGIETVYQDLSLVDSLSVAQNFFLGRELDKSFGPFHLLDRRGMRIAVEEALSTLSVNVPSTRSRVRYLSGGQRQAVAIARAATFGRRLVIMDEPTAALGVQETERVEGIIGRLRDRGLPIVLISHDMQQVLRVSDQVWVLRAGKVAGGGRTVEFDGDRIVGLITGKAMDL